jgi:hypothetical protein
MIPTNMPTVILPKPAEKVQTWAARTPGQYEYLENYGDPVRSDMLSTRADGSRVFCASAEDHFLRTQCGW